MVGLEALSMQGLPVDKLLLTRETEDQLADLAGNAMSTTVVGACILAALVTGKKLLKHGGDAQTYEDKNRSLPRAESDAMAVDNTPKTGPTEARVVGEEHLQLKPLDLTTAHACSLKELLHDADMSKRLCSCEGRMDMTLRPLSACQDCGSTFCQKCGGRPEHNPELINIAQNPRLHPSQFSKKLKETLPMCISLSGIENELLHSLRKEATNLADSLWSKWQEAVLAAASSEFRYVELKRQEIWSVIYQSPVGALELSLHPKRPQWRLFARPKATEPANAEIREVLQSPVGRLTCGDELLVGQWQFALPSPATIKVKIEGLGDLDDLIPSWEARLGLVGEAFKTRMVYPKLKVSVEYTDIPKLDRDISGVYELLHKCGTANGALHKKIDTDSNDAPPLFMLFDPHRTNDSEDCFVFSISTRRLEYQECRPIVCRLDPTWRQSSKDTEEIVQCHLPLKWITAASVLMKVKRSVCSLTMPC